MFMALFGVIWSAFTIYIYRKQFTYYSKWLLYVFLAVIMSLICIPVSLIRGPKQCTNALYMIPVLRVMSTLLGVEWDIHGAEHLYKQDGSCVVVANHQSCLDVLGMIELWPAIQKGVCIAKSSLLWAFPFGPAAYLVGTVFIDRGNTSASRNALFQVEQEMKMERKKVFVFPEGTRNLGEELLPFKKGAFHMAIRNRIPIVPIVFGPYDEFINHEQLFFGRGTVRVTVMPLIETTAYLTEDVTTLTESVRHVMNKEFCRLRKISYENAII